MAAPTKFERIAAAIESDIRAGRVPTGDTLASENALVQRFGVSRNTIRKSLGLLVDKGLIATRVGSGSFVTYDGELIDDAAGWSVSLSARGARLQSRILRLSRGGMEFDCFALPVGSDCLCIDRIRFRVETGLCVSLERSRIPWHDSFDHVLEHGLVEGSITKTLEIRGMASVGGREWASVERALSAPDAALMGRTAGEPMLRLRRLARAADNSVVEFVESLLDPDLFGLSVAF
jgi:GntR family transcriptional regulator